MSVEEIKDKKVWPRTIAPELHAAWLKLKRKKDPEVIAEALGYSRPVIDRALLYGYISIPELTEKINKFFIDRLNKEKQQAQGLMGLAAEVENLKK